MRDDACCRSGVYERRAVRDRARREHVTARRVRRHGRGRVCHLSASFGGTWISIQPLGRARRKAPLLTAGVQCPRARRRIHRRPARPAHMRALVSPCRRSDRRRLGRRRGGAAIRPRRGAGLEADESSTTRRARWFTATPRRASPPPPAGSSGIWTSARGPRRAPRPPRTSSTDPRRESSTTSRRRPYLTTRRSALSDRSSPNTAPRTRARRRTRGTLTRSASSSRVRSISTWRSCRLTRPRSTAR